MRNVANSRMVNEAIEAQNALAAANGGSSASQLLNKYKKTFEAISRKKGHDMNPINKYTLARCLENTSRYLNAANRRINYGAVNETTQPTAVSNFKRSALCV